MANQTGKHVARLMAAKTEPSPITALRDMLATAFAADIAAVTPMVCDVMREDMLDAATPARRDLIRIAVGTVARNPGALAMDVAQIFRVRFDATLLGAASAKGSAASSLDLALMDETLLEISLALDQCATRLKEQASAEMFQLTARVAAMLDKPSLDDADNPIAPRAFACTLADALGTMGLGSEQRLAVFKAFGPPLLSIAPDLYDCANELLTELGVLAGFTAQYGRPIIAKAAPSPRPDPILADEKALAAILDRLLSGGRVLGRPTAGLFAGAL